MPQSPGHQSADTSAEFGANEWLVEEMFEQYQRDPNSVAPEWVRYFQSNGHPNGTTGTDQGQQAPQETAAEPRSVPGEGLPSRRPRRRPRRRPEREGR